MIKYRIYQNKKKNDPNNGKYYARVAVDKTVGLAELAQHMSEHNTPFSQGAIYGILTDMVSCIHELTLDGKAVKIPNLAIFSIGINTLPADKIEDFNVKSNIKSVRLRSRATGVFSRQQLNLVAQAKELSQYYVEAGKTQAEG